MFIQIWYILVLNMHFLQTKFFWKQVRTRKYISTLSVIKECLFGQLVIVRLHRSVISYPCNWNDSSQRLLGTDSCAIYPLQFTCSPDLQQLSIVNCHNHCKIVSHKTFHCSATRGINHWLTKEPRWRQVHEISLTHFSLN